MAYPDNFNDAAHHRRMGGNMPSPRLVAIRSRISVLEKREERLQAALDKTGESLSELYSEEKYLEQDL